MIQFRVGNILGLVDIEHRVVAENGNRIHFSRFGILLFVDLPEYAWPTLFTLLDVTAPIFRLLVGQPVGGVNNPAEEKRKAFIPR